MKNAVIIILFDHPWEHTSDYASQTGSYLRKNNLVLGVLLKEARSIKENIIGHHGLWFWKKVSKNYVLIKPLYIIPFKRFRPIERANIRLNIIVIRCLARFLSWKRQMRKIYLWVFNPEHYPIVKLMGPLATIIYDCVDFHGDEPQGREEQLLIKASHAVFVNSHILYSLHRKIRDDIHLIPLGFDVHRFSRPHGPVKIRLPHTKPIVGYIGGVNSRLDYHLLVPLVRRCPMYNFVFVGPIQMHESPQVFRTWVKPAIDKLFESPNVYYYPSVPRSETPEIIRQFDVGMIPYDCSRRYNAYSFPMKLFEYFYEGKPVVSTAINELKRYSHYISLGTTVTEWKHHLRHLTHMSWPLDYRQKERRIAKDNSWENKIDAISAIVSPE